jgi:hypothetical protein
MMHQVISDRKNSDLNGMGGKCEKDTKHDADLREKSYMSD